MPLPKNWKKLLKFTGPVLYVFFLIKIVDFGEVADLLSSIRLDMIVISGVLFPLLTTALTYRWWLICRQLGMQASFGLVTRIYYISWFLSILPLTGTTAVAKILYLKDNGEQASRSAISITFEKALDITGLMLFGLICTLYLPQNLMVENIQMAIWGAAFLAGILALGFGPATLWPKVKSFISRHLSERFKETGNNLETILIELWASFNLRAVCIQVLLAIIINLLRVLVLFILALSLNINISLFQAFICRVLIGLVNFIPISNSGLGTRDAVLLLVLPLWGISLNAAMVLGFTAFLWTVFSKIAGVVLWFKYPLPIKGMRAITKDLLLNTGRNKVPKKHK